MEHGTFAIDHEKRKVDGILVPWGEKSRTSASKTAPITFPRGAVFAPRDPSIVTLNVAHDRFAPIGRAVQLEDRDAGLYAAFQISDTPEGDAWLADRGEFVKLSAEVRNIVRNPDDTGTAELTGAALVTEGAFASAALFAIDDEDVPETTDDTESSDSDPAAVESTNEPDDKSEEEKEEAVAEFATVPGTHSRATETPKPALTRHGFVQGLFAALTGGSRDAVEPYVRDAQANGLFAITDVTYDDATGLNVDSQLGGPAYLGQLWRAVADVRTFIPAIGTKPLTDMVARGWNLEVPEGAVDEWAGNKTEIPSEAVTTSTKEFKAQRFAGGNDLAREFFDFNKTEVISAYLDGMVRRYQQKSDAYALAQTLAGATTATPGTVPANVDKGLAAILDLATAIYSAGGTPNVVRVAPDVYRSLALTLDGNQFAYLSASLGIQEGGFAGLSFRPDNRLAAGQLLVADKNAVGIWELPGSPIRVDAVEIFKGGIDKALFGYVAAGVVDPTVVLKATLA